MKKLAKNRQHHFPVIPAPAAIEFSEYPHSPGTPAFAWVTALLEIN